MRPETSTPSRASVLLHPSTVELARRRAWLWLGPALLATALVTALNVSIFRDKQQGFAYRMASYYTVYHPSEMPAIERFSFGADGTIGVEFCPPCSDSVAWKVTVEGERTRLMRGPMPRILMPNTGEYYKRRVVITTPAFPYPITLYLERQGDGEVHLIHSSVPFVRVPRRPIADFADTSWYSASGQLRAEEALRELRLEEEGTTLGRVARLAHHLRSATQAGMGSTFLPGKVLAAMNGAEVYDAAVSGRTRIACNEYTEMFFLFANLAGIPTRRVGIVGHATSDGVLKLSGHHFNESFIAEQGRWAFVDLTSDKAYVLNADGRVLNAWELFMANQAASFDGLRTASLKGPRVEMVPYEASRASEDYYFSPNATLLYKWGNDRFSRINQAVRYLLHPELALSLTETNSRLRLKQVALAALALLLIADAALVAIMLRRRPLVPKAAPPRPAG